MKLYRTPAHVVFAWLLIASGHLPGAPAKDEIDQGIDRLRAHVNGLRHDVQAACGAALKQDREVSITLTGLPGCFPDAQLKFSSQTLDADLDAAVEVLTQHEAVIARLEERAAGVEPAEEKPMSLEDRLKAAEAGTEDRTPFVAPSESFNIFEAYSDDHKRKQAEEDKRAEADMAQVNEERRLAEARLRDQEATKRAIAAENTRFQAELDAQASKDAELAADWKRKHGVGAFTKGIFRSLVGGTVNAAAGQVGRGVGRHIADAVIQERYPRQGHDHGGDRYK